MGVEPKNKVYYEEKLGNILPMHARGESCTLSSCCRCIDVLKT